MSKIEAGDLVALSPQTLARFTNYSDRAIYMTGVCIDSNNEGDWLVLFHTGGGLKQICDEVDLKIISKSFCLKMRHEI